MYQQQSGASQQQADQEDDSKKAYKTDEELRKEFEQWKKTTFTEYDQSRHDEFLKNRFYKYNYAD